MQDDFQTAYNIADELLENLKPVTDKDIVAAVDKCMLLFQDLDRNLLEKTLLANHATQVDDFKILEGRERRLPWLKGFKAAQGSEWDFWNRYVKYLKKDKQFPDAVSTWTICPMKYWTTCSIPRSKTSRLTRKGW